MKMKSLVTLACAVALATPAFGGMGAAFAQSSPVIALSNSFYGNVWRRQMVDAFTEQADAAKAAGLIADYTVLNGDGSVAQQNSQLAELILRGVDTIVVAFDSLVTHECAWKLGFDVLEYKAVQAEATLELIGHEGNLVVVRGVRGSGPDEQMYAAQMGVLEKYPNVNLVATVYGQATASVAQQELAGVLPSLPRIDAVLAQGGSDDYGIARAFELYGGPYAETMPVIEGGGSSDFIIWWNERTQKEPYRTTSMNTTPGIGGAAFWLAYEITQGAQPAMEMIMPVAVVDADNLAEFAEGLAPGFILSPSYDRDWVQQNLLD